MEAENKPEDVVLTARAYIHDAMILVEGLCANNTQVGPSTIGHSEFSETLLKLREAGMWLAAGLNKRFPNCAKKEKV